MDLLQSSFQNQDDQGRDAYMLTKFQITIVVLVLLPFSAAAQRPNKTKLAAEVKAEFIHAWNGYKKFAWGHDDLRPLTRTYHDWYGESLLMTPVDSLDTMIIMGFDNEARNTREYIVKNLSFDKDIYVQNFEITIRLLGGLLSSYQLTGDKRLLKLAEDLGNRLLPAFESPTGMPYRFVNLKTGKVRDAESNPAETGTLLIEFGTLAKLTKRPIFYEKAKRASEKAVRANDLYLAYADEPTYYLLGCCHDLHLMMFTCMLLGQYQPALWAADTVRSLVTRSVVSIPDRPKLTQTVEGYHAMKSHVLVRFGRWQEIIDEPMVEEPELYVLTTAMQHYAKGVAHATLRNFPEAEQERERFHLHLSRIPLERRFLSNPTRASLAVGAALLDGELAYHQGRHEEAYRHLRQAVELDDNLSYTEPWAWMHPPRHALAALLLDQGHAQEAEQVYRDDLGLSGAVQRCAQHPNNVWALHGLAECLRLRGETEELPALQASLATALAKADVPITSSCLCRTSVQSAPSCCQ